MERSVLINQIQESLLLISRSIEQCGMLNLNDAAILAEYSFKDLLNLIYDLNLINANGVRRNMPGIDLIDEQNKIVIQVSKECTKTKIQNSLDKIPAEYRNGYHFWFMSITKSAMKLKDAVFNVPDGIIFNPQRGDIKDNETLLNDILELDIEKISSVKELLKNEFSPISPVERKVSGLAVIIKLLSNETFEQNADMTKDCFEIEEKIKFNKLDDMYDDFINFMANQGIVERVYDTYDKEGKNKSLAVLHAIRKAYLSLANNKEKGVTLFHSISHQLYKNVRGCHELSKFSDDEIEFYIDILMYDAFTKCKIFKRPNPC